MTYTRSVVLTAALLGLLAPQPAAGQAGITGAWIVSVESPQGSTSVEASFTQDGEKVTGEVESPMGRVEFSGTLVGKDLLVSYSIPVQGNTLEIKMTGVVEAEKITGTIDFGGLGQANWTAVRKAAEAAAAKPAPEAPARPAADAADVTGKWNIVVRVPAGEFSMSVTLAQSGQSVTGSLTGPMGLLPLTGTMVGRSLTLEMTTTTPQGDLSVTLKGELGAAGLKGSSNLPGVGEAEWVGTRVQ